MAAYIAFVDLKDKHQWSTLPSIVVAVIVAGLLSLAFQAIVLRALRRAAPIVRVIATIGTARSPPGGRREAVRREQPSGRRLPPRPHLQVGRDHGPRERIYIVVITLVVTFGLWAWTRYTRVGLAINASAQNERAVRTLGWSPDRLSALTWTVGGLLGGFAAVLAAPLTGLSATTFTIVVTVAGLGAALLGGFQSFPLTLLGGSHHRCRRGDGHALRRRHHEVAPPGPDHGTQPHAGVPRDLLVVVVGGRGLPLRSHVAERLPRLGSGEINVRGVLARSARSLLVLLFARDGRRPGRRPTYIIACQPRS